MYRALVLDDELPRIKMLLDVEEVSNAETKGASLFEFHVILLEVSPMPSGKVSLPKD